MLFRVVLVTIFLGSALVVDVSALSSLSDSRNATILGLIVGTYLLTIVYAILVRRLESQLAALAIVQLTLDIVITVLLIAVTGGLDSLFLFLFHLNIVNAAVVLGRKAALYAAGVTTVAFVTIAAVQTGTFDEVFDIRTKSPPMTEVAYRVSVNSAAAFIIAVLAGYLAERLGEATSQLQRQQMNIRELKALNENILASLSSGLLTIDDEATIIFFNRAAEEITAFDQDEVLDEPLHTVFPGIADRLARGEFTEPRYESIFTRPDGEDVYLGFSVSTLRDADDDDAGRIIIFQDLSDIRRMELKMRRSERLAAVGELAAAIAHEIRNPLASISGSVEMLEQAAEADDDEQTLMRIILREVDRLDDLISEFLNYSRPHKLKRSQTPLDQLVGDVLELFRHRTGNAMTVEFEASARPVCDIDREAFQQVLWNLLNNAADATGGLDDARVRIELDADDEDAIMAVEDNGPGVDPEVRSHIFEPFFTTKEAGTGLGLATIYRLVEEHDGRISLEDSGELGGAHFQIRLPIARTARGAA